MDRSLNNMSINNSNSYKKINNYQELVKKIDRQDLVRQYSKLEVNNKTFSKSQSKISNNNQNRSIEVN